jgi:hypothetical protein
MPTCSIDLDVGHLYDLGSLPLFGTSKIED